VNEKLKSENMQKGAVFYVYVIFREQSGQAGVENGAMLTTYLFRYTSECTSPWQIFKIFFASGGKGALTPLTKIPRTFLVEFRCERNFRLAKAADGSVRCAGTLHCEMPNGQNSVTRRTTFVARARVCVCV